MDQTLSFDNIHAFRQAFSENTLSRVAARAVSGSPIDLLCLDLPRSRAMDPRFSLDIPTLPACDQQNSGRCWIFAGLSLLREKIAKDLKLTELELSQNYLSFYDHLEKANTFYEQILETAGEPLDSRRVARLLSMPIGDGGWWEYFVGLCCKYGVVPQDAMPETYQSNHSDDMNILLNMQLRKDALELRRHAADPEVRDRKEAMLARVYNVLAICLGTPPEKVDFKYFDKDHKYVADRDLTPRAFYDKYIGKDLNRTVSILNAPISSVPFHTTCYTKDEESLYGSYRAKRLNLPLEEFKAAVIRQLRQGSPVWFVCDCDYYGNMLDGIWDVDLYDYESLLGLDLSLSKGEALELRQCSLNHAMLMTGVNLVDGKPDKWKIQNSWGTAFGKSGYFLMSDAWFDRYVFTASIDRDCLTLEQNAQFDQEPQVLEPWNVLG